MKGFTRLCAPARLKVIRYAGSWIEIRAHDHGRLYSSLGYHAPNEVEEEHRRTRQTVWN